MEENSKNNFFEGNDKFTYEGVAEHTEETQKLRAQVLLGMVSSIKALDEENSYLEEMHIKRIEYDPEHSYRDEYSITGILVQDRPLVIEGTIEISDGYSIYTNLFEEGQTRRFYDYKEQTLDRFVYRDNEDTFDRFSWNIFNNHEIDRRKIPSSCITDFNGKINVNGEKKGYNQ